MTFMEMMRYQYVWHNIGLGVFNLEIFVSKIHLVLVDQSLEKSTKLWKKVEQDRYISSRDIGKELNIDHKTILRPFGRPWRRLDRNV